MLNIKRALGNDRLLRAFTGLNRKAFDELCLAFDFTYRATVEADSKPRKRARGGGRKARLESSQAKLFFILTYFKCYPTFDVLGLLFELERGRANRWVHRLQPLLEETLGEKMMLPERKIRTLEQFVEYFPEVNEVLIDGTERPIQRPQDSQKQERHYSGKKKRHTRKHLVVTTPNKRILLLSQAREGKIHDKKQLDEEELVPHIPDHIPIMGDLGYLGLPNEFINIHIPHKKPKGKELSEQHKQENREFSRHRIKCEHAIGGMKRYGSVTQVYRNRKPNFDDRLMLTSAGLWNFYLDAA